VDKILSLLFLCFYKLLFFSSKSSVIYCFNIIENLASSLRVIELEIGFLSDKVLQPHA